jgi:predicted enzyme related to lactoylglutathione lyase
VGFYRRVFGFTPEAVELSGQPWHVLKAGADLVAGVVPKPSADLPDFWNVYFATGDVDATCRRAADLGGTVTFPPTGTPIGPMAGVRDPQGARFSLWTFVPPADAR